MRRALLLVALVSSAAYADSADDEIARGHFATGVSYYDSGRFEQAVKEFTEAYRLSHRPLLLFNIARAYEKAGDPGRASAYYRRYLDAEPASIERSEIATKLESFAPRVGELVVRSDPPGADIAIDGEGVGTAPLAAQKLTAGKHEVVARSDRYAPTAMTVEVVGRGRQVLTFDLRRGRTHVEEERPSEGPATVTERPRWFWPVIGGVGAAVVAAVVLGLVLGLATGTDYTALGRGSCSNGCAVIEFK